MLSRGFHPSLGVEGLPEGEGRRSAPADAASESVPVREGREGKTVIGCFSGACLFNHGFHGEEEALNIL